MDDADGCNEYGNRPAVMLIIRYLVFISDLDFLAKILFKKNQICIDEGTVASNMSSEQE